MSDHGCLREPELLDSLRTGAWPEACEEDLRLHAESCESCRDLVEVVGALLHDKDVQVQEAAFPGSGLVWWKLQMRIRHEAAQKGRRTLLLVQGISLSAAGALALLMIQLFVPNWCTALVGSLPAVLRGAAPIVLALVACIALAGAPLAAYLASRKG
jgi:predicted anti-sigma-YlaC factor YlaD